MNNDRFDRPLFKNVYQLLKVSQYIDMPLKCIRIKEECVVDGDVTLIHCHTQ